MTVHCSHASMCVQCPAESWERSHRPCGVNSQHQSVSWSAITIVIGCRGEELTAKWRGIDSKTVR